MKTIKIRHFCRLPVIIKTGLLIVVSISLCFLIIGIQNGINGLILIGAVPLFCCLVGLGFFFCYGIKITPTKVSLLFHNVAKTFPLENVDYIRIAFNDNGIWGEIKPFHQRPCFFEFTDFMMKPSSSLSRFLIVRVKITKRLADKMIVKLSRCKKVRLEAHKAKNSMSIY